VQVEKYCGCQEQKQFIGRKFRKFRKFLILGCTSDQAYQPATTQYQKVFLICEICEICGQIQSFSSLTKAQSQGAVTGLNHVLSAGGEILWVPRVKAIYWPQISQISQIFNTGLYRRPGISASNHPVSNCLF
jgi:hypothetical protein